MIVSESPSTAAAVESRGRGRGGFNPSLSLHIKLGITIAFFAIAFATLLPEELYQFRAAAQTAATTKGFPYSTPITLNNAGTWLWVTNPDPDNNSVTVVDVTSDAAQVLREIKVGVEPNSVAVNGDDSRAYVANTVSGTVSVIRAIDFSVVETINVGTEPRALCFSPNFTRLYVACSSSNDIHVINPVTNKVVKVIKNPSFSNLFAITITNDGDADDNDELLYVTNLLAEYIPGSKPSPADDLGKQGIVNVVSLGNDEFIDRVALRGARGGREP